jgi:nitrate reductase delta subunit
MAAGEPDYVLLAGLLDYPDGEFTARVERLARLLEDGRDGVADLVRPFFAWMRDMTVERAQELYTRTFDINPVCTLEVGWHIYGEDYARGEFLVKMRQRLRQCGLPESKELPDHLTHVLVLLGRLDGGEADELAARYVLPALEKMLGGMADVENPYKAVLEAVVQAVRIRHDVEAVSPRRRRGDPPGWKNRLPIIGSPGRIGG